MEKSVKIKSLSTEKQNKELDMKNYKVNVGSYGYELRRYEGNQITGAWIMGRSTAYRYRKMLISGKSENSLGLN